MRVDAFPNTSPAGVAQLECTNQEFGTRTVSLGGVLDTQLNGIPDIALVTAHGLSASLKDCQLAFKGERLGIVVVRQGRSHRTDGDWAVVTLDGRFKQAITRLHWYVDNPDGWESFAARGGRVRLLKFTNGETGSGCDVLTPRGGLVDATDGDVVIVSDCPSLPGMSGAPAMVEVDGTPAIIGLNIGMRYDVSKPPLAWKSRANVIRLIDDTIEAAIVRAIATAAR